MVEDLVFAKQERANRAGGGVDREESALVIRRLIGNEGPAIRRPGDVSKYCEQRRSQKSFFFSAGEIGDEYLEFTEVGIVVAEECASFAVGRERDVAVDVTDDRAGRSSQNRGSVEDGVVALVGSGAPEVDVVSVQRKSEPKVMGTFGRRHYLGVAVARDIPNPEALKAILVFLHIQDVFSIGRNSGKGRTSGGRRFVDREILKRRGMAAIEERIDSKSGSRDHNESHNAADPESEFVLACNFDCD